MGIYTYWYVAGNKEKPFKTVLGLILGLNTVKWKMPRKLGVWSLYNDGTYAPVVMVGHFFAMNSIVQSVL